MANVYTDVHRVGRADMSKALVIVSVGTTD